MTTTPIGARALLFLGVLYLLSFKAALADIIYVDVPDIPIFGVSVPAVVNLDVDDNGATDFVFTSTQMQFSVDPQAANRVVMNLGNFVAALPAGTTITSTLPPTSHAWSDADEEGIVACASFPSGPVCIGEFHNQTAFVGLEFDISGSTHYGWMQLEVGPSFFAGGTILDYAYESTPGQAIAAGAIPEPSTLFLMLVAGGGLAICRTRQRGSSPKHTGGRQ